MTTKLAVLEADRTAHSARIVLTGTSALPSISTARPEARKRLRDFFSSHIRNRNSRRAYLESVRQFAAFCAELEIIELAQVEAAHVAAFVERQLQTNSRPRSSCAWRRCACSSTGWWSAR